MKVSNCNSNYIQQTTCGRLIKLIKNILKREYNKGKYVSQIIFRIFFILLILILRLFFLINFPERKSSKKKVINKMYWFYTVNSTTSTSLFTFY